jgi:hypothetical protein
MCERDDLLNSWCSLTWEADHGPLRRCVCDSQILADHGLGSRLSTRLVIAGYSRRPRTLGRQVLTIIRPETLVRWHRAGFRCVVLINEPDKELQPVFETQIKRMAYHLNGNGADVVMAIDQGGFSLPVLRFQFRRWNLS